MKNSCGKYSSEEISRFVDNELPTQTYDAIQQHLSTCTECSAMVKNFSSLSDIFSHHAAARVAQMEKGTIAKHLHSTLQKKEKSTFGNHFEFLGKHMVLKVASLAIILMISLFAFQNTIFPPTGPSAIVKSVDTDFASVMIIETQKKKHTIIWFNET